MNRRRLLILLVLAVAAWLACNYWREHRFDAQIAAAAARYRLPAALVKAIVWRESRFHPHVRGSAGELGLMQVREDAAYEWAAAEHVAGFEHAQCLDPATNTLVGAWYLHQTLAKYKQADDPLPYALAEYNAGRGNVLKWRTGAALTNSAAFVNQIGFPGTKAYVRAVIRRFHHYE